MIDTAFVSGVLLPASLGIIMLGLGMTLHPADFRRILSQPKAVLTGLCVQMLLLTAICFGLCLLLKLPPELAVGMMLLAAAPGGASANIYSHLAGGDVALNITLTAVNSLLCLLSLPLVVGFSLAYFMAADQAVPPPFAKIIEVGLIILLPVAIGGNRPKSDLNLRVDVSIRQNNTVIRKMQEGQNQVTAGQNITSIKTSADYVISQRLNVRLFYERVVNKPVISTSFPSSNSNFGLSLRFTLTQ